MHLVKKSLAAYPLDQKIQDEESCLNQGLLVDKNYHGLGTNFWANEFGFGYSWYLMQYSVQRKLTLYLRMCNFSYEFDLIHVFQT